MDSRLLATLNAQARSTRDPVHWARAVCRAASHFARHGQTKEALTSIGVVRAQFGPELQLEIASWLMLAEGVLHFFQWKTTEAYDRMRRAYGLAVALKTESALPSCAAWMAHIEFNAGAYDKMVDHLKEAITSAPDTDHQALARASLVMADALQLTGNYPLAKPWYERARQHATAEGDEATVSALLYNVAAFRAANVRLADTFGFDKGPDAHRATMEASSSTNYDFAIGTSGLSFLTPILRGLVLTIDRKYLEASAILESIDKEVLPKRTLAPVYADIAWCHTCLGNMDLAWEYAARAIQNLPELIDADDIAYSNSRVAQVAEATGRMSEAQLHRQRALENLDAHRAFQENLLAKLLQISKY
jgi:tetratricopeptide (TPR) repeat protein